MPLPTDPKSRKGIPMYRGLLCYFPDALAAVAECSAIANEQHNPGEEMHWAREKSTDHEDCLIRHMLDLGEADSDGVRHAAKMAWRALAILQLELEAQASLDNIAEQLTCHHALGTSIEAKGEEVAETAPEPEWSEWQDWSTQLLPPPGAEVEYQTKSGSRGVIRFYSEDYPDSSLNYAKASRWRWKLPEGGK